MKKIIFASTTTKETIQNAAYDLFLKNGFHGTSMRQIAARAGIAVAGIYNHFPDKESIYKAVLLAHHPFRIAFPAIVETKGDTVEEYLRHAAATLLKILSDDRQLLKLVFVEVVEFDNRHMPMIIQEIMPLAQKFLGTLLQKKGELRVFPPPVILRSFIALFFSYYLSAIMVAPYISDDSFGDAFDAFLDIYLHGALAKS